MCNPALLLALFDFKHSQCGFDPSGKCLDSDLKPAGEKKKNPKDLHIS